MKLRADKKEKEKEEEKKRQKEETYNEIFKRSNLLVKSPEIGRKEKEDEKGDGENEMLTILKEIKEKTDMRKEVREMKEGWKTRVEGLGKRQDTMEKKIEEIEGATTNQTKEEDEGKLARMTDLIAE